MRGCGGGGGEWGWPGFCSPTRPRAPVVPGTRCRCPAGGRPGAGRGTGTPPSRLGRAGGSGWSRWLRPGSGQVPPARLSLRAGVCDSQVGYAVGAKTCISGGGGGPKKSKYRISDCRCFERAVGSGVVPGGWCHAGVSRGALPAKVPALSPRRGSGLQRSFGRRDEITLPLPGRLLPLHRPAVLLGGTACARCPVDVGRCRAGKPLPLGAKLPSPPAVASRGLRWHGRHRQGEGKAGNCLALSLWSDRA